MGVAEKCLRESETQGVWTISVIQDGRVERNDQLWRNTTNNTTISKTGR